MIQVRMIHTWEEKERLSQYVTVRCPHQSRISSSKAYGLLKWDVVFGSNWLIQFIMPAVKLSISVFYLGFLQYLIYLEFRFLEGKKSTNFWCTKSWILFTYLFSVLEIKPRLSGTPEKYFTIEPRPQFNNLNYDNKTH